LMKVSLPFYFCLFTFAFSLFVGVKFYREFKSLPLRKGQIDENQFALSFAFSCADLLIEGIVLALQGKIEYYTISIH
jgi:hypothetical protein